MWQRIRRKWSDPRVEPGYTEGGIWKTTDGGKTWTDASQGLPAPRSSAAGSASTSRARTRTCSTRSSTTTSRDGRRARASATPTAAPILEARIKAAEIYRTDDKGATWRR